MAVTPCPAAGPVDNIGKNRGCYWHVWPCGTWCCRDCGRIRERGIDVAAIAGRWPGPETDIDQLMEDI